MMINIQMELINQSVSLHHFFVDAVDSFLELSNDVFGDLKHQKSRLHMFPSYVKVNGFDRHFLMQFDHVWTFVVVGSAEEKSQKLHHGGVQLGNITDILKEEVVNSLICQYKLIELGYHFLQVVMTSYLLKESCHLIKQISQKMLIFKIKQTSNFKQTYFSTLQDKIYCYHININIDKFLYQSTIDMDQLKEFKLHFYDEISPSERILTTQLARTLTQTNLRRIQQPANQNKSQKVSINLRKEDFLYVCLTGLPSLEDQYEGLGIPGQKIVIYPECFEPKITEERAKERMYYAQIQLQAQALHQKLKNRTDKPLIFIFHSFGTTIMSALFRLYYNEYLPRVKGIIAIGAYTIQPDPLFRQFVLASESLTKEYMTQNIDLLYQNHIDYFNSMKMRPHPYKYSHIAELVAFGKGMGFGQMFSYIRRWFPVLKCFIYGREDNRIDEDYLNQTAIYYCHKKKFDQKYQDKVRELLEKRYELKTDNVQQRFVFNIHKGKHSVHFQHKFKPLVSTIIKQYLETIELI